MPITKLPGLIDVHVHLREPGATQKEDFDTGTAAAVRGGYGFVIDMPNNPDVPTISIERLEEKIKLADAKKHCEVGFHYGTNGNNLETFEKAAANPRVYGLKVYCNHTTGELLMSNDELLINVFNAWGSTKPILVHAEGAMLERCLELAQKYNRRLHHCHTSLASEVELLKKAKQSLMKVTAGATPHHLFLTNNDRAIMKPPLATQADQDALWQGIRDEIIDVIETDHAPHTPEEKAKGAFGVSGLETTLGLMGLAIHQGRITEHDLLKLMYLNPKKIFNITHDTGTIAVDFDKSYTVDSSKFASKAKQSPFDGWTLYGTILRPY